MVDYRNCTDNMFNSAMAMKNKDVDKIPTNYLYILYTKYKLYILIMSIEILNYWRFLMRDIDYGTVRIKLNELIEQQGISKNRLAHRAEMQRTQLNQYCNGEVTRLDIAVLARLCCALDCKVEDLLEYVPPEQE